jgi:predicted nucleic acid-binding protein
MISIDANILLYSYAVDSPFHEAARNFVESLADRQNVALTEFIPIEFYLLLRKPAVLQNPLAAPDAAAVIGSCRKHPLWKTLEFPPRSREFHDQLWKQARSVISPVGASTTPAQHSVSPPSVSRILPASHSLEISMRTTTTKQKIGSENLRKFESS